MAIDLGFQPFLQILIIHLEASVEALVCRDVQNWTWHWQFACACGQADQLKHSMQEERLGLTSNVAVVVLPRALLSHVGKMQRSWMTRRALNTWHDGVALTTVRSVTAV